MAKVDWEEIGLMCLVPVSIMIICFCAYVSHDNKIVDNGASTMMMGSG